MSTHDSSSDGYLLPPNYNRSQLEQFMLVFHVVIRPRIAAYLRKIGYAGLLRDRLDEIEDALFARLYLELDDREDAEHWRKRGFASRFWLRDIAAEHCGLKLAWNPADLAELADELVNEVASARWATDPNATHQLLDRASVAFADPRLQGAVPLLLVAVQELGMDFVLLRSALMNEAEGLRTPGVTPLSFLSLEEVEDFVRSLT